MNRRLLKRQQGLNLIELMIAITIGVFISLMVVQYLVTSSRLFKQQGVDSNLESNGTFAISYLSQFIRQAGSRSPTGSDVPFFVGDCDDDPCTFNSDDLGVSDQLAVQMFPVNNRDCVNNEVDDGNRIANVFFVADSDGNRNPTPSCGTGGKECALYCRGYDVSNQAWLGNEAVALIDGIDQLQVLYGVSNDNKQIDRYVDASRVPAPGDVGIAIQDAWDRVRSVKLAVLVSDGQNSGTEIQEARSYQLLDSPTITFDDRVSRKIYSTTVTINNKLP